MNKYDCVLIHPPKFNHYFHPLGRVGFVNVIATGLLSMADVLHRDGFNVKVVHLGVEKLKDNDITIEDIIKKFPARIYGISLQWHFQSYDAIRLSQIIKKVYPDSFVVMGGIQASVFKEEILGTFNSVDAVVVGDGEVPLLKLTNAIIRGTPSLEEVPNTFFNKHILARSGTTRYVNTSEELSKYNYARFDLLNNFNIYKEILFFQKYEKKLINSILKKMSFWLSSPIYITIGKGCPYGCSFCAGGYNLKNVLNYKEPQIRNIDTLLSEISYLSSLGIKNITSAFYYNKREDVFKNFFYTVGKHFKDVIINADWWPLPSYDLIEAFSELNKRSTLILLVWSLSEYLRSKNTNSIYFTNEELFSVVRYAYKKKVRIKLLLYSALPFETAKTIKEESMVVKELLSQFGSILCFTLPTELSPGSPMFVEPQRYEIIKKVNSFNDYYKLNESLHYSIGYEFVDRSEKEILRDKCNFQCLIHPFYGKSICNVMHKLNKFF